MEKSKLITRVGEVRPSQLMFTYGVGALVDLPKLSVIVSGLDDWQLNPEYCHTIAESRLLQAVQFHLHDVERIFARIGLGDEEVVETDANDAGIFGVKSMFDIDKGSEATLTLGFGDNA